jgi:hypothetical protein
MDYSNGDRTAADLAPIEERLRADRVTASPIELDELKLRAMRQAAPATPKLRKGMWMKSRLALTLMVMLGLMMSTTGAGLAISGSSDNGSAAKAQYGDEGGQTEDKVVGTQQGGEPAETQPIEQVAVASDNSGTLPFTGFFTIPLIVGGVVLLSGGAVLRWRARD